jgi:hypothetical protein
MEEEQIKFIEENIDKSWQELAELVNDRDGGNRSGDTLRKWCNNHGIHKGGSMPRKNLKDQVAGDKESSRTKVERNTLKKKYGVALSQIDELEGKLELVKRIGEISTFEIKPRKSSGDSESVAVLLCSDWHVEENVDKNSVNGLNEYSPAIARQRAKGLFQSTLRLIGILQNGTKIDTLVLALLGDFITGNIHEDLAENRDIGTSDALIFAESLICSGIDYLLANSELNLVIPCHSGNHGRATKDQRIATENENSHEYYMYHTIAGRYRGNKRVKFILSPAYHSYLDIFGVKVRFHHGHFIKYAGGIGGLFVPAYRAISNWNDGIQAGLDCFGHFHQTRDGGTFICNGSLIGYNPYGTYVKGKFEKPKQVLFLIEKKRGRTFTVPVLFSV